MDPREADLYGDRVLALLTEARETLSERYGVTLDGEVTVEIFPRKADFAVRTFGLPGADGFLGVCFGRVVTAISPAAQGESPSSWESVLWHEFCHAVTLEKTRNTMPRWLSEGISVFEEGRRNPAWSTPLGPHDRERLLADDLTPLSQLSAAFLGAKSGRDVQFAYLESALAVEFLVDRAGPQALRGLLADLGTGKALEEALPARAGMSLVELDEQFARFARQRAEALAPGAAWEPPDLPPDADSRTLSAWLAEHPDNVPALIRLGARLVAESRWDEAESTLERLRSLYPEYVGADNPYMLLAEVHRNRAEPSAERADLEALLERDADAVPALLRLLELDRFELRWDDLARDARRLLGVNPLIPAPHRALAEAAERLGDRPSAIAAYQALARLDDPDPAGLHYHLALLLRDEHKPAEARREVLKALEEAPRYREAHALLLELVEPGNPPPDARPQDPTP
jgi:tetratricopeptide (TPR) repeat protein